MNRVLRLWCRIFGHDYPHVSLWDAIQMTDECYHEITSTCTRCGYFNEQRYEERLTQSQVNWKKILKITEQMLSRMKTKGTQS
jgi:uncharacterized Fe-S cluster-containing MiaB family protein